MTNDNYVINEHGAWGNPSEAVRWYRAEVNRLREALAEQPEQQESEAVHAAWMAGYTEGEREAIEKQTAQQQELAGKWTGGWVVVHGDPIDGLQFTGPFSNADDAHNWAAKHLGTDWWISPMETWSWDK